MSGYGAHQFGAKRRLSGGTILLPRLFGSKMDLSIEFDNPHGVFIPGSEITGTVTFSVSDPLKARAVVISVDGRANTHWTVSERHSSPEHHHHHGGHHHTTHVQNTTHRTITYSSSVSYAAGEATLWSPAGSGAELIPVGNHRYPFKFQLPVQCPPSFEGMHGYIRYQCKAKIDRPWKFDYTTRKPFTVVPTFDLNVIPLAALPVVKQESRDTGVLFWKSGRIDLTAKISKGGYVPGESIVLQADIKNNSSKTVNEVELKLVEVSRYTAHRNGHVGIGHHPKQTETRVNKRTVTQFQEKLFVEKGGSLAYSRALPIPPIVPTFNTCPIVQVEYYLKIRLSASGICSSLSSTLPILIGTIPIRQYVAPVAPAPSCPYPTDQAMPMPEPHVPQLDPPPSYAECVFGKGTIMDDDDNKSPSMQDFAPRYVYYPNIMPSAPPLEQ